jgi:hypothetical protein
MSKKITLMFIWLLDFIRRLKFPNSILFENRCVSEDPSLLGDDVMSTGKELPNFLSILLDPSEEST